MYHKKFSHDPIVLKLLVDVVYLLDFAQIILLHEFAWDVFVTGIAVKGGVPTPQVNVSVHTMITSIIAAMVQIFFAWRVYFLRRDSIIVKIVVIVILMLAVQQCTSCLTAVGLYLHAGTSESGIALLRSGSKLTQAWLIGAVICDLIIATAMTIILIQYSRASSIKRTQTLVRSLIVRSVETGTMTLLFTVLNLVLFTLLPTNYVYMVFDRSISKLYSNALLLSLNARQEKGAYNTSTNWNSIDVSTGNSTNNNNNTYGLTVMSPGKFRQGFSSTGSGGGVHISKQSDTVIDQLDPYKPTTTLIPESDSV
jgi:hypothetical protein